MDKHHFASLTPANSLAKIAFSEVFEAAIRDPQKTQTMGRSYMQTIRDEQEYDGDVLRFRLETARRQREQDAGYSSDSLTDPNTDTDGEPDNRELGLVWTGHYVFALGHEPSAPQLGWTAGKSSPESGPCADLLLSTKAFAKQHAIPLRTFHARFNFEAQTGVFFVARNTKSPQAELSVNGVAVDRETHALHQHKMKIRISSLDYVFEYTEFASAQNFVELRRQYVITSLSGPSSTAFEMPTPLPRTRTIGQWTLGSPLGKGAEGKVYLGSNSKGDVVAVKLLERNAASAGRVDDEIKRCKELTSLARGENDGRRIVQLKEAVYSGGTEALSSTFDEVALVLEPMTPHTFGDLLRRSPRLGGMSLEAAELFRDALEGLRFLHRNGWIHGDVKPRNIGILAEPLRAVLLDLGQARRLSRTAGFPASPGFGGTVNYLSPEREMDGASYNHGSDIWSMGVVGYELTYGHHPFKFASNPWRSGEAYEKIRPAWHQRYNQAISFMADDYERYCTQRHEIHSSPGCLHLGGLLVGMLRHPYAEHSCQSLDRIDASQALRHEAWGATPAELRDSVSAGAAPLSG